MRNLYSITTNQAAIIALFRVINRYVGNLPPMPGVFPDYPAPVIRNADTGREMVTMRWGMPPPPRNGGPPVTNIRNTSSPHWRMWLKPENRCLVLANSFAEYAPEPNPETGKKDVVLFALNEERPLFALAGIWTEFNGDRGTKLKPIRGSASCLWIGTFLPFWPLGGFKEPPCQRLLLSWGLDRLQRPPPMTVLISIFLLGSLAIAAISTDFSYEDTRQAFSDGNVPNESELAYEWMLIGSVSSKDKKPVYSADGWFKYSQDNGQYRVLLDFQKKENDPSGRAHYTSVSQAIDRQSGKPTIHYVPDLNWTLDPSGLVSVVSLPRAKGNETICGLTLECRLVKSSSRLLCDKRMTGPTLLCKEQPEAHMFQGYIPIKP